MESEDKRIYNETAAQLLQEVSLHLATENVVVVSSLPISLPIFGPSVLTPSAPQINATEGTSVSVPQFVSQSEQMNSGGFGGFKFQSNFSSTSRPVSTTETIPVQAYPGLDGHTRRITPIPISVVQGQPSMLAMDKSPDEIQKSTSELIQRLEKEKAASEDLAKKYKKHECISGAE